MADNVTLIHHMPKDEFAKAWQNYLATYGETASELRGLADQEMARLFVQSGWIQEELAAFLGGSQKWADFRLRFGRFLTFSTTGTKAENVPKDFTERRFRSYWERTQGTNERQRFTQVLRLMDEHAQPNVAEPEAPKRAQIGQRIIERFGDGKWHTEEAIIEAMGAPARQVIVALANMRAKGTFNAHCARRPFAKSHQYRIVTGSGHKIDYDQLMKELQPILKGLETEGKKNQVRISPDAVAHLTIELRQLLAKLAK